MAKKRKATPAQLAALKKGRAKLAAKRAKGGTTTKKAGKRKATKGGKRKPTAKQLAALKKGRASRGGGRVVGRETNPAEKSALKAAWATIRRLQPKHRSKPAGSKKPRREWEPGLFAACERVIA